MEHISTFTHDGKVYNLDKVRVLVRNQQTITIPIKELLWVLKFDKPGEDRIFKAKFRYPLLIAKYKNKWAVVDGLHRLEKYRRKGITQIPCKIVIDDVLKKTLITHKGLFVGRQRYRV